MKIKLFEMGPTRSARVRWTLLEAGLEFEAVDEGYKIFENEEFKKAHPLRKLPAVIIDGKAMFESAAICTHLADMVPDKQLIAKPGTWERAMHEQWTYFGMTELEAHLWSSARNTFILPEEKRIPAIIEQNRKSFRPAAKLLDSVLADKEYLVGDRFSVTDIIMGYTMNWAHGDKLLDDHPNLQAYRERLLARPHCPIKDS
ncbi:MAG: glutathione S-transferase family protein [Haliangiales bacterium]